jgi:hypothetical protein
MWFFAIMHSWNWRQRLERMAELTPLGDGRRPIMVVSHERSGTHFMMNAMALCFGYISNPHVDIDRHQFNINYYHPQSLQTLILKLAALRAANILKDHHEFEFFSTIIGAFEGSIDIIYIHRNPADVLTSFWRFLNTWNWVEGPKVDTALEFAKTPPMGQLMRYQFRQYDTMLDRWANHVKHWVEASSRARNIHIVRYEDLANCYDDTIKGLGAALGLKPRKIERPPRDQNVVQRGSVDFMPAPGADDRDAVATYAMSKFPELVSHLGYDENP